MKIAIINASFGCSIKESREKYIEPFEDAVRKCYNDIDCFRVFTSEIIRKKIKRQENIDIDDIRTCLTRLWDKEYTHIFISVSHIIPGFEYEKILRAVDGFKNDFRVIKVARTFLDDQMGEGEVDVVKSYVKTNLKEDEAVVLVGHGTEHYSNKYYGDFEKLLNESINNLYIVSVKDKLVLEKAVINLKNKRIKKIYLYPLLIAAGEHVLNNIVSNDDESIKSYLKVNDFEVESFITGLGSNDKAIKLLVDRIR